MPISPAPPVRQRGAALIIGLIMLLILTLLGVAAISNVTLQERMAGSLTDHKHAFQAAEIALRRAEDYMNNKNQARDDDMEGQAIYDIPDNKEQPDPQDIATWNENYLVAPDIAGLPIRPRYRFERQNDGTPTIYRLSAIGYGKRPDGSSTVVLQTTFSTLEPL